MGYVERYKPKEGEGHNKILVVTGISGVGKDFLLSESVKQGVIPPSVKTFSFGEELLAYFKTIYPYIRTRNDIRNVLTQEQEQGGITEVIDRLIRLQPTMLGIHVVYKHRESLVANPDIDRKMHPVGYIYVWGEPDQIAQWRTQDTSRLRKSESVEDISLHQNIALEIALLIARYTGAGLKTLWNRTDNVVENLATIKEGAEELT